MKTRYAANEAAFWSTRRVVDDLIFLKWGGWREKVVSGGKKNSGFVEENEREEIASTNESGSTHLRETFSMYDSLENQSVVLYLKSIVVVEFRKSRGGFWVSTSATMTSPIQRDQVARKWRNNMTQGGAWMCRTILVLNVQGSIVLFCSIHILRLLYTCTLVLFVLMVSIVGCAFNSVS